MDLEAFTRSISATVRRYRTLYGLLDFLAVTLVVLLIAIFFNMGDIFKLIPFTEPYVGLSPNIPIVSVPYEIIFLFFIVCILSVLILEIFSRNQTRIYKLFNKTPPKRLNSKDLVERTYPELKDRLKTACDNSESENIVAAELKQEVISDVGGVSSVDLLDKRRLAYTFCTIFAAVIVLVFMFSTGVTAPFSPGDLVNQFPDSSIVQPPLSEENATNSDSELPTDIPPISSQPGVDIDVTLPPGAGMGPGDLLEDGTDSTFTPSEYHPPESLSSQHFYDILPAGYQDVVRDYFRKLAEQS